MNKKHLYYLIVPILAFTLFFIGWLNWHEGNSDNSVRGIKQNTGIKEIKVVLDRNYPPYIFSDDKGVPQGILVDEWRLWEEKTGIKVNLTPMVWADALSEMEKGEADVLDTVFENPQRDLLYDFTEPYASIEVPIFFHRNISGINGVEALKGFTVAAKNGDNAVEVLIAAGITNIKTYSSEEEIVKAAKNGEVVVFVIDKPPALYFMYKLGVQNDFNYSKSLYTGSFHRAVKKGNTELLKIVEFGFSEITAKEYKDIETKWFGKTAIISTNMLRFGLITVSVMIGVFLLLSYWNISLKNRVTKKTHELTAALKNLERSNSKVNGIINAIPDLVFLLNFQGAYVDYLSRVEEKDLYLKPEEFIGKTLKDTMPQDLAERSMEKLSLLKETKQIQVLHYDLDINGSVGHYESRFVLIDEELVLCIVRDISDNKKSQDLLYSISIHDMPTGLYNRNYFETSLELLSKMSHEGTAIAICDIDGLKLVNDTLGHAEGDNYINVVAKILYNIFPKECVVSRIGGDEFAIIYPNATKIEMDNLKNKIAESIDLHNKNGKVIPISLSVGYCIKSEYHQSMEDVFKEADDFMYREKLWHRRSVRNNNVDVLYNMMESKDFVSVSHGENLRRYSKVLAAKQGMTDEMIKDIELLAQFHDVGQISIDDKILFKPGSLTDEEWTEIKRHTEIGYRIAEASPELRHISELIFKHHEWWDGSGYPFGIKGKEIPIQCRIFSVADAYDAMTSERSYRRALSKSAAIEELRRLSGKQFEPAIVEDFIGIFSDESTATD